MRGSISGPFIREFSARSAEVADEEMGFATCSPAHQLPQHIFLGFGAAPLSARAGRMLHLLVHHLGEEIANLGISSRREVVGVQRGLSWLRSRTAPRAALVVMRRSLEGGGDHSVAIGT